MAPTHLSPSMACNREHVSHYGTHTFITIHGLHPRTCVTLWHPHIYHHPWPASRTCVTLWHPHIYHRPWPASKNMRYTMAPVTHFITVHGLQSRTGVTLWHPHIYHRPWPAIENMRHTMAPTHLSPSMACNQEHASHYGTHTFITVHGLHPRTCVTLAPTHLSPSMACNREHASHYGTHTFITVHGLQSRTCITFQLIQDDVLTSARCKL